MLNIESILTHIYEEVKKQSPRFVISDDEHIIDTKTGITLHMYDNWFKITYNDANVIVKDDFTTEEQAKVWTIKQLITPPEVLENRKINFKPLQDARRVKLSSLFEKPIPGSLNIPVAEEDTIPYIG